MWGGHDPHSPSVGPPRAVGWGWGGVGRDPHSPYTAPGTGQGGWDPQQGPILGQSPASITPRGWGGQKGGGPCTGLAPEGLTQGVKCMHTSVHTCMCMHGHAHACTRMHAPKCAHLQTPKCTPLHTQKHTHAHPNSRAHTPMHTKMHTQIHTPAHTHTPPPAASPQALPLPSPCPPPVLVHTRVHAWPCTIPSCARVHHARSRAGTKTQPNAPH